MAHNTPVTAAADDEEEFEEFEGEQWPVTQKEDASLWDAEWDNDEIDEEFAKKFQMEMEKMEVEKADKSQPVSGAPEGTE